MPKNYYAIKGPAEDGKYTVYTADTDAFQIIVGWGSGSERVAAGFYGTDAKNLPSGLKGNFDRNFKGWQWTFGREHAEEMLGLIEKYEHDDNYYNAAERKRLPDLKKTLKFILEN
jgi:hypothetical protein